MSVLKYNEFKKWVHDKPHNFTCKPADVCYCPLAVYLQETVNNNIRVGRTFYFEPGDIDNTNLPEWGVKFVYNLDKLYKEDVTRAAILSLLEADFVEEYVEDGDL